MAQTQVSQVVVEVLEVGSPVVQVSQVAVQVLYAAVADLTVSQVAVEVLRSVADTANVARRTQAFVF